MKDHVRRRTNFQRNRRYASQASYYTPLSDSQEKEFRNWLEVKGLPVDPDDPMNEYDLRGIWKALKAGDPNGRNLKYWMTPYHDAFSAESRMAMPNAPNVSPAVHNPAAAQPYQPPGMDWQAEKARLGMQDVVDAPQTNVGASMTGQMNQPQMGVAGYPQGTAVGSMNQPQMMEPGYPQGQQVASQFPPLEQQSYTPPPLPPGIMDPQDQIPLNTAQMDDRLNARPHNTQYIDPGGPTAAAPASVPQPVMAEEEDDGSYLKDSYGRPVRTKNKSKVRVKNYKKK